MGYWKTGKLTIGDAPLDLAASFLGNISESYLEDIGRKPKLDEVLTALQIELHRNAEQYTSDCDELVVTEIKAKTKKRPRKQQPEAGDVFLIPLGKQDFAYGRVLPHEYVLDFFTLRTHRPASPAELRDVPVFRLPYLVSGEFLEDGRWRIVGRVSDFKSAYKKSLSAEDKDILVPIKDERPQFVQLRLSTGPCTKKELAAIHSTGLISPSLAEDELRMRLRKPAQSGRSARRRSV